MIYRVFGTRNIRKMEKTTAKKTLKHKHQTPFKSPFQNGATSRIVGPQCSMQSLQELQQKLTRVDKEIHELKLQGLKEEELQTHIDKLHEYNEIKDVGQIVLGRIANLEGVRTKDLYERYGLQLED